MTDYITNKDTIIFGPKYNKPLDNKLLLNHKKIIFSNYKLNNNLFEKYENNDFRDVNCIGSKFNQPLSNSLDNLTNLTHLTFGRDFNQPLLNSLNNDRNCTRLKSRQLK